MEKDIDCAICLGTENYPVLIKTGCCNKHFHKECLDKWLNKGNIRCPLCNQVILKYPKIIKYLIKHSDFIFLLILSTIMFIGLSILIYELFTMVYKTYLCFTYIPYNKLDKFSLIVERTNIIILFILIPNVIWGFIFPALEMSYIWNYQMLLICNIILISPFLYVLNINYDNKLFTKLNNIDYKTIHFCSELKSNEKCVEYLHEIKERYNIANIIMISIMISYILLIIFMNVKNRYFTRNVNYTIIN